jgi:hypothetical protein
MSDLPIQHYGVERAVARPSQQAWPLRAAAVSARILFWGAIQFALSLAEQVAELLAPMTFIAGIIWWAVLRVLGSMQLDDGTLQKLAEHIPATLIIGGHLIAPGRLIEDGLLLMALVAGCRTVGDIIAKET